MKVKIRPPYIAMTQQRYCCIPTCIQMILERRGYKLLEQEVIGIDLGLVVAPEHVHEFANVSTEEKSPAGWGTRINLEKYSLNSFFKKRNIALTSTYYTLDDIDNPLKFIGMNLTEGNDILTIFRYNTLYNEGNPYGHGSLIEEIHGTNVTLVDPSRGLKRKRVLVDDLVKAIEVHRKGDIWLGGFWSFFPNQIISTK